MVYNNNYAHHRPLVVRLLAKSAANLLPQNAIEIVQIQMKSKKQQQLQTFFSDSTAVFIPQHAAALTLSFTCGI